MSPKRTSDTTGFSVDERFPPGSVHYYVGRSLPEQHRRPALARFALLSELQQLRYISEPELAASKLAWWREELARWRDRRPRHPITQALERAADMAVHDEADAMLDSFADPAPVTDRAGLSPEPASVWLFVLRPYIVRAPGAARALGCAHGHCAQIADFGYLQRRGLVIANRAGIGTMLAAEIARALTELEHAATELAREAVPPARVMIALDHALMTELARDPAQMIDHRVRLTPLRMAWLSWRAQRQRTLKHP